MPKGICLLSVIPMRAAAASKSEMVSQLLFGETYEVMAQHNSWIQIKTHADNYEAWISANQYEKWDEISNPYLVSANFPFINAQKANDTNPLRLLPGSILHQGDFENNVLNFQINQQVYHTNIAKTEWSKPILLEFAKQFLGSPYLWGGRTLFGIDCSGFTQLIYKVAGLQIPRDAYQQADLGEDVSFVNETQAGDLAFFDNAEGRITHVGMMLGKGEIIHASGMVRIDVLDSYGIFNEKLGTHTHKLRLIKRLLN